MNLQRLNTTRLEFLLKQKAYRIPNIRMTKAEQKDPNYRLMEQNNRVLGRSFHHTFDKAHKMLGRIPTPQEFIAFQMKDVKKSYASEVWRVRNNVCFKWTETVEKGIKQRLLRSYISFINERHTELSILEIYPNFVIKRSDKLDYAGIDLVALDYKHRVSHKLHITKNSEYAIDFLFKKEGKQLDFKQEKGQMFARPKWTKINHQIYKERDFTGHTFLLYDEVESDSTKIVNGYALFKKQYLINKIQTNTQLRLMEREAEKTA